MKWFQYRQNNSGGSFYGPKFVLIQAENAEQANIIAEQNDIYFDGCAMGMDCSCCGDRWYRAGEYDAEDEPKIYDQVMDLDNPEPVYSDSWGGCDEVKIIKNPAMPANLISKRDERQVAADLLEENGFDDIAKHLRNI